MEPLTDEAIDFFKENYHYAFWFPLKFTLTESFIREFADKLDWTGVSAFQVLSEDSIREFKDKVDWYWISRKQVLSESFIREFKDQVDWINISLFQTLSEPFVKEFRENWNDVSHNPKDRKMAAHYYPVSLSEMDEFLSAQKFVAVRLKGCKEAVYSKVIGPSLCLRVWTGIKGTQSRGVGEDAIRVSIHYKDNKTGKILPVGSQSRTHRVQNWKVNLQKRINEYSEKKIEICGCGRPMVLRENKKTGDKFFGCVGFMLVGEDKCSRTRPASQE